MADGMLVVFAATPLLETRSGPNSASKRTASHIETIASEAHISRTRTRACQRGPSEAADGAAGATVDISHLLSPVPSHAGRRAASGRGRTGGARTTELRAARG